MFMLAKSRVIEQCHVTIVAIRHVNTLANVATVKFSLENP
jgi:hypothetical protein